MPPLTVVSVFVQGITPLLSRTRRYSIFAAQGFKTNIVNDPFGVADALGSVVINLGFLIGASRLLNPGLFMFRLIREPGASPA